MFQRSTFRHAAWFALLALVACAQEPGSTRHARTAAHPSSPSRAAAGSATGASTARYGASLPGPGALVAYDFAEVRHDGAYTWHRAQVSEAHAIAAIVSGRLRITTPAGDALEFDYDRHVEHPSGDWSWIGHLPGHPEQQAIVTFGEQATFGSIAQPGRPPLRLIVRNGASWLVETDPARIAGIHNAATRPVRPDYKVPPTLAAAVGMSGLDASPIGATSATTIAAAGTVVDVVLGYTPGFASDNGGNSGAVTRLNHLVDVTNAAYVNSQVNAQVNLVAAIAVNYTDSSTNDSALDQLTGDDGSGTFSVPVPSSLAPLRAAREQYGADLVSLVRKFLDPDQAGCGLAWLIGGGRQTITSAAAPYAYSVVGDGPDMGSDGKTYYCRDETLAHELGHNMGSAHDVETAKGEDHVLQASEYGAFTYSFGYKTGSTAGNFYTVMAYGDTGQTSYRIFSNPATTFCGGFVCGISNQADNARSLRQTIPTIATFRATVVTPPPPVPPPRILLRQLDANGNGTFDLLFFNHAIDRVSTWFMSGAIRSSYSSTVVDGNWRLVDAGDFNGDGRTDLLFDDAATRRLVMGLSTGTSYALNTLVNGYAAGTVPIAVADINGNGKADILLRNVSTGRVTTWYMSGATRIAYNGYDVPPGHAFVGSGDLNGDHRQDLLWTNSSRQFLLSTSQGTTFTTQTLALAYQSTYAAAGLQDVNGDGKSDILLVGTDGARLVVWYMNGASRISYNSHTLDPAYRLVGKGDFDGNHRGDLVMSNPSTRQIKMLLSSGTGFAPTVLGLVPQGGSDLMDVQ
jgi:hypothetical protein